MWPVATMLDSTETEHSHHQRKLCCARQGWLDTAVSGGEWQCREHSPEALPPSEADLQQRHGQTKVTGRKEAACMGGEKSWCGHISEMKGYKTDAQPYICVWLKTETCKGIQSAKTQKKRSIHSSKVSLWERPVLGRKQALMDSERWSHKDSVFWPHGSRIKLREGNQATKSVLFDPTYMER